jgi:hypothetical protein
MDTTFDTQVTEAQVTEAQVTATQVTKAQMPNTIDAQVTALKQSFTIKTENNLRFVCYNNIIIGKIVVVFTVEFVYYHAPTMIRLFPIFESKYFSESLNFYIYKSSPNGHLNCEQLTSMLHELERHKQIAKRILNKYIKSN